jgi:histidinol-phosphate aminotransferase
MSFINKFLRNLAPYKVASHKVWEVADEERKAMLKLDWNEATVAPSPKVKKRLIELLGDEDFFFLYPSTQNEDLLLALSFYAGIPKENIQYFGSSDSLQEYLVRTYVTVGDPVLILAPTYDNFRLTCQSQGAQIFFSNYSDDFVLDEGEFIESIMNVNPSLIYICNPNNPTGGLLSNSFLKKIVSLFPDKMFLIDEAYFEFSEETMAKEVLIFENILITRTFSKAFALANFRAGYLMADRKRIIEISKISNPKNISTYAQEAMLAVLSDTEYMRNYVKIVNEARAWFVEELLNMSFVDRVFESRANFILVKFKSFEDKMIVFNHLTSCKIFVRNLTHSEMLLNCLRITIGTKIQMERVKSELEALIR